MTMERLLKVHSYRPFMPYIIHVADGSEIHVKAPDMMSATPNGRTIEVLSGNTTHYIDLLLVARLTTAAVEA